MKWSIPLVALGTGLLISCGADTSEIADSSEIAASFEIVDSSVASFAAKGGKCSPLLTQCNGKCVNLQTDPVNCGTCGNACDGKSPCVSGTCPYSCPLTCSAGQVCCWVGPGGIAQWRCYESKHGYNCGLKP